MLNQNANTDNSGKTDGNHIELYSAITEVIRAIKVKSSPYGMAGTNRRHKKWLEKTYITLNRWVLNGICRSTDGKQIEFPSCSWQNN